MGAVFFKAIINIGRQRTIDNLGSINDIKSAIR